MQIPAGAELKCEFGIADAIGMVVIWVLLTIVTLGLAAFVAPYYLFSAVVNKTSLVDDSGRRLGRLKVNFTLAEIVGHAVIWLLLTIVTLGLALIVYYYMVLRKVLDRTEVIPGYQAALPATPRQETPIAAPPSPAPRPPANPPQPGAIRR
jgi:flagellar basal body-associated protein FliL